MHRKKALCLNMATFHWSMA